LPTLDDLRLKTGQLITEDWFSDLVDYLEQIGYGGVITLYGYAMKDIVPYADLLLNLGLPLKRWKELHAGTGTFTTQVTVGGHPVIKDGDPITVSDFGAAAEADLETAVKEGVDTSDDIEDIKTNTGNTKTSVDSVKTSTDTVKTAVDNLLSALKPSVLNKKIETFMTNMTEFFTPDLVAVADGRLRVKFTSSYYVYLYLKHKLDGEAVSVWASLNAGIPITANAWHEWDFTITTDDTMNLRVSPASTVTVIVYNIPNA
jgi:hypothetical protein